MIPVCEPVIGEREHELVEKGKDKELQDIRNISTLADVHFIWQKELNGLGDAISYAKHHVGDHGDEHGIGYGDSEAEALAQKALAAGFDGEQVDGNDVVAVSHAVGTAVAGDAFDRAMDRGHEALDRADYRDAARAFDTARDDADVGEREVDDPLPQPLLLLRLLLRWLLLLPL